MIGCRSLQILISCSSYASSNLSVLHTKNNIFYCLLEFNAVILLEPRLFSDTSSCALFKLIVFKLRPEMAFLVKLGPISASHFNL